MKRGRDLFDVVFIFRVKNGMQFLPVFSGWYLRRVYVTRILVIVYEHFTGNTRNNDILQQKDEFASNLR